MCVVIIIGEKSSLFFFIALPLSHIIFIVSWNRQNARETLLLLLLVFTLQTWFLFVRIQKVQGVFWKFTHKGMADFDAIYEDDVSDDVLDDSHYSTRPEPIIIRGCGNFTV